MTARIRALTVFSLLLVLAWLPACSSVDLYPSDVCTDGCELDAKICSDPTVLNLARDLDHLEKHIETYGSVVIQQPHVWGQARLTKYREDFEREMVKDLPRFEETLQAQIAREDQAFLLNSFALSAAISGPSAMTWTPTPAGPTNVTAIAVPGTELKGKVIEEDATADPTGANENPKFWGTFRQPDPLRFKESLRSVEGDKASLNVSLEPTLVLEQKARYLNFLNQLRRTNEGDDTADAPGYSLNLLRVPVSLLPGKRTDTGFGAEITITLEPVLGEELLPTTFRNLVINDLVDQIGLSLVGSLNSKEFASFLTPEIHSFLTVKTIDEFNKAKTRQPNLSAQVSRMLPKQTIINDVDELMTAQSNILSSVSQSIAKNVSMPALSYSKLRNASLPFPVSQLVDVYGVDFAYHIAFDALNSFRNDPANQGIYHLPDIQAYLQEELAAAYRFLSTGVNQDLWQFCDQYLADWVRTRQYGKLEERRMAFVATVKNLAPEFYNQIPSNKFMETAGQYNSHSTTVALAWAILVESAILNERLIQDMRETSAAKGCPLHSDWLPYYLPTPPAEARHAFNQYVGLRWPILVFALDPQNQDQNLADVFTRRRETQLAMSLAFLSGNISVRNLTRYARRLESAYDTIAINRTVVGFSHGEKTFGWRFYPRFQTPEFESNFVSIFRDQLIGGPNRNQELRQHKLEPGIRECVAIVLMPAFVPFVECHTSSNWFKLTNPRWKVMDNKDAVRLSKMVQTIRTCGSNIGDADCYRGGDLYRLLVKAEQLSERLPLQSRQIQVPYENSVGGFEMFNTGITDLAPELLGWYGAEGVNLNGYTTLFLIGDHFSVTQTRVVAGGQPVSPYSGQELLSRQVLRVSIPPGTQTVADDQGRKFVRIQVATPYGVTRQLLVPAIEGQGPPVSGFLWAPAHTLSGTVAYDLKTKEFQSLSLAPPTNGTPDLVLLDTNLQPNLFTAGKVTLTLELTGLVGTGDEHTSLGRSDKLELTFANQRATVEVAKLQRILAKALKDKKVTSDIALSTILAVGYLEAEIGGIKQNVTIDNLLEIRLKTIDEKQ